jgi:fucose 4-O-acetylase-like acetyltransferase
VVIHHSSHAISTETFSQRNIIVVIPDYVENVQKLVGIITAIAVPMFFLFSAYFLYFKERKYIPTMKKKCRTILLPYFLWNLLLVLLYYLVQTLPFIRQFFMTDPDYLIKNYGVIDWIDVFWGKITYKSEYGHPFHGPFWFLRDLFILNTFFVGIKKLIDKFPMGIFILFFILWANNIKIYIVPPEALLFFSFGYYIVKYDLGIKNINGIKILDLSIIYGITIILEYFFIDSMPILHKINILIGCMFFLKISQYFIENIKLYKILTWLEKYQFFVYAAHATIISQLLKIYTKVIPLNGMYILVGYFFMIFFGVFISLIFGIIFKRLLPKLYEILTGGRM